MRAVVGTILLAALFWGVMFGLKWGNFWLSMSVAAAALALVGVWQQRGNLTRLFAFRWSHLAAGIGGAAALYVAFFLGDRAAALVFDFAPKQVEGVYAMKAETSSLAIGLLLFFVIGPAEEVYWRGFVQDRLSARYGGFAGWLVGSLVYAGVHLWAWNLMLVMAALLCGLFWGLVYWRWKSLWPGIISHAVWDVAIFILMPVR